MSKDYRFCKLAFRETKEGCKWFAEGFLEEYTIYKDSNNMYNIYTSKYLSAEPKKTLVAAKTWCQKHNNKKLQIVVDDWIIIGE